MDGLGLLQALTPAGDSLVMRFSLAPELRPLVAPKGSIAVDGVSLTVNEARPEDFTVNLIPHTRARTTLGLLRPGAAVNLETDLLAKYVRRLMETREQPGLSLDSLARGGFLEAGGR